MKNFFLMLLLSLVLGTGFGWAMNYIEYGHRDTFFGEITTDGSVTADNVMAKLKEYQSDSTAIVELQSEPTHDFGAAAPGTKGTHQFIVKNIGDEPLILELGASTCKCTIGDLKDTQLAPGASTTIDMEWTVQSDKTAFEQSAELRTNDPTRPAVLLKITGIVISDIEFDPKEISFGDVLAGETFEISTNMYCYYDQDIEPVSALFGSKDLTKLSDFRFEPFEPSEQDGVHKQARQAFRVVAKVKPGLRQGPMVTTLVVTFKKNAGGTDGEQANQETPDGKKGFYQTSAEVAGEIVGSLGMIENTRVKSISGGGYIWNLGRIGPDEELKFKALVVLKGSERDGTTLRIGETYPSDVVQAEFGAPLGKGKMRLFPINLTLKAGAETLDLLGKNKDDFGWIWIESDNPKVSRMRVAVKVMIEARP